jgi:hypothetical protein
MGNGGHSFRQGAQNRRCIPQRVVSSASPPEASRQQWSEVFVKDEVTIIPQGDRTRIAPQQIGSIHKRENTAENKRCQKRHAAFRRRM